MIESSRSGGPRPNRRSVTPARGQGRVFMWLASLTAAAGLLVAAVSIGPVAAADNPYQRGPDPTPASVAATRGTFATAQISVPAGNGFNGGMMYYPTDNGQGTFGGVAIVPGYTARFADEEAWMGPWLASFGFVVIGIETNSGNDFDSARATQLLAGLDYLTQRSSIRDRVDRNRLSVIGHSMGGGGALLAAVQRPSLKAAVGLAPFMPSGNLSNDRVPTMILGGQNDTTVTPSSLDSLYSRLPATTEAAHLQFSGANHLTFTRSYPLEMRILIPWLKIFVDNDTRYTKFLCPLADATGVAKHSITCPLVPSGGPTGSPTSSRSASPSASASFQSSSPSSSPSRSASASPVPGGVCTAAYRTTNSWSGGYQGEVTVTAGGSTIHGWTVHWTPGNGPRISQVWNATVTTSGSTVSVHNASYNGTLSPSAATTFGFIGGGAPPTSELLCTSL